MIVVKEAKEHIQSGAVFAKMTNEITKDVIYWLKYASRNGFEIPNRTGRYLEKQGFVPEKWHWSP